MYVMCINDSHRGRILKIGAVYKVVESSDKFYRIVVSGHNYGTPIGFFKSRFIVVKENRINRLLYKELE